jgi:hypothetical protein
MKMRITLMAIPALMLAFVGYAQEPSATAEAEVEATAKSGAKGAIEVGAITATSKVIKVDPSKRTVTLTNEAGETNTYKVGKNVRNFDEIKVGDLVKATLLESVAVTVSKSGATPAAGAGGFVAVAPKGATPGVVMTKTRQITAKIVSVDPQARTVTVEGPMGGKPTIKVGPNVNLGELQAGDDVTLRVTDALAIRAEKP